jgi:hypothetical protein
MLTSWRPGRQLPAGDCCWARGRWDHDLIGLGGPEITPAMKLKRQAGAAEYADVIESLYAAAG